MQALSDNTVINTIPIKLMSITHAARALSVIGHPALLMPVAVTAGASAAGTPTPLLRVALATIVAVAVIVGLFSLWQVRVGRWAHVDASHPSERSQLNLFLAALLCAAAGLLWALGQPAAVAAGPLLAALLVLLTHALRRWLKVSLHAAFAAFAAALLWPDLPATLAIGALSVAVAWSRLVLRRHTLSEVLLGLLLGAAFGIALLRLAL
jgi:membrane-associated phospholipid phosphatase